MAYVLGVDIGTSGTKTVLFDQNGAVIASASEEYPLYQPQNGCAEQDPADWYQATIHTIAKVMKTSGVPKEEVKGIGLSGQMHGLRTSQSVSQSSGAISVPQRSVQRSRSV